MPHLSAISRIGWVIPTARCAHGVQSAGKPRDDAESAKLSPGRPAPVRGLGSREATHSISLSGCRPGKKRRDRRSILLQGKCGVHSEAAERERFRGELSVRAEEPKAAANEEACAICRQ